MTTSSGKIIDMGHGHGVYVDYFAGLFDLSDDDAESLILTIREISLKSETDRRPLPDVLAEFCKRLECMAELIWPGVFRARLEIRRRAELEDRIKAMTPKRKLIRKAVLDRDGHACKHCGTGDDLTLDHIIPRSRGGTDDLANLQTLCRTCNSRKGARMPESA